MRIGSASSRRAARDTVCHGPCAFYYIHAEPCTEPPWGALTALDLRSGKKRWEVPLGFLVRGATRQPELRWSARYCRRANVYRGVRDERAWFDTERERWCGKRNSSARRRHGDDIRMEGRSIRRN